jgi:uncharacterized protein YndB with AHSA1/START domain
MKVNPELDLVFEKHLDITPEQAFHGWTTPSMLTRWFCPDPWKTIEAEVDLRPGGKFNTVMQSPEGEKNYNLGCILEVIPGKKLITTDALVENYRPKENNFCTISISFLQDENGCKVYAIVSHKDNETKNKHEEMGFYEGWGIAHDQLVAAVKGLR